MCFYKLIDTIGFVSTVGFNYSVYCGILFICWGQCLCLSKIFVVRWMCSCMG